MPHVTLSGGFISRGNNIITDARTSTGFTNGVLGDTVGISNSVDPMLGPLANNGGGIDTRAPQSGSLAINSGNNCVVNGNCELPTSTHVQLPYDQRQKYSRLANSTVDIGAFETNAAVSTWMVSYRSLLVTFGSGHFYGGSTAVLTNVVSGETKYAVVSPTGSYQFGDFEFAATYFLEIRAKRHLPFAVRILPF
jgi:hypothetical protein